MESAGDLKSILLNCVNETPMLLSMLYDLNLMPEQVFEKSKEESMMYTIIWYWREREIEFNAKMENMRNAGTETKKMAKDENTFA